MILRIQSLHRQANHFTLNKDFKLKSQIKDSTKIVLQERK